MPVLYNCIEDLGGKCVGVEGAKIVVTALKGRARLGKVLGREWVVSGLRLCGKMRFVCYEVGG